MPSQTSRRNSVVAAGEDVNVDGECRMPPKVDIVGNDGLGLGSSAYGGSLRPTLFYRCCGLLVWSRLRPSNLNSQQNHPQILLWTDFTPSHLLTGFCAETKRLAWNYQ